MANITVDVPWRIVSEGTTVIGNDQGRFDTWRQTGTLGPEPPNEMDGPPETNGTPPGTQRATE